MSATTRRRMLPVCLLIAAWLFVIRGVMAATAGYFPPDDPAELARTWKSAQVVVYGEGKLISRRLDEVVAQPALVAGAKHPAILYLHGCDGLFPGLHFDFWQGLAKEGYAVFMPDSFARRRRTGECGTQPAWTYQARLAEVDYAVGQLRKYSWIDSANLVLYGHSEGGVAASRYRGTAFKGVVISSASCWRYMLQVPSLAVRSVKDERLPGATCPQAGEHISVPGKRHEVLEDRKARAGIRKFIHRVTGRAE